MTTERIEKIMNINKKKGLKHIFLLPPETLNPIKKTKYIIV
jgi:hypothetical protein